MRKILITIAVLTIGVVLGFVYNHYDVQSRGNGPDYNPNVPVLRTPDARFEALADFPFAPHYVEIEDPEFGALWVAGWRRYILKPEVFPISSMVADMTDRELDDRTLIGLDAPYPDESFKAGPRRLPMMIPATPLHAAAAPNRAAWQKLRKWDKPTLTLISERLATAGFAPKEFHDQIPGTAGQPHATDPDTGFFLIEENPEELAAKTIEFIEQS